MLQFKKRVQVGNMAESIMQNSEEDHHLEDFFPKGIPYNLQPLIDYRIKLLTKNDTVLLPGETQVVNTSCVIKGKGRRKLSMFLIPHEHLPLSFESGGYIEQKYAGRVAVKLTNYTNKKIHLNAGATVAYIVIQPFSIE